MGLCYRHEETRGLNKLHQRGVHCGRNCALERSRRQLRRVPTMRSPLLPPVSLQLRLTCREGPTLSCCPVPLLAVVSRILSILFESSSGLSLDLELFVLLHDLHCVPDLHAFLHTLVFWWGRIGLIWEMGTEILYYHKTLKNLSKGRALSSG